MLMFKPAIILVPVAWASNAAATQKLTEEEAVAHHKAIEEHRETTGASAWNKVRALIRSCCAGTGEGGALGPPWGAMGRQSGT
jgi:hypothetical protein